MKCPKCGNNAPEGSAFCNQCGTALNSETVCPSCNNSIPANSVFCPKCGKMVKNDMDQGESFNERQERLNRESQEQTRQMAEERKRQQEEQRLQAAKLEAARQEQKRQEQETAARREAERQAALQAKNSRKRIDEDDDEDDEEDEGYAPASNFNRNLLVGIGIVVAVVALLMIMRNCGNDDSNTEDKATVTETSAAETIDGQDPVAVFNNEIARSSYMGDGAQTAFVKLFPAEGDKKPFIMGVTFQSNASDRSFYKIYRLEQEGSAWHLEFMHQVYLNGRGLSFDNSALMASDGQVPRAVKVDGNDCLYFAYKNMPQGAHEGGSGRVTLCLYDINAKKLTSIDYDGIIKTRSDGRQYVYGKPLQSDNSSAARFLKQEAASIKLIYFPTDEELKAEADAEAKAEEEAAAANDVTENAAEQWNNENASGFDAAKNGEEVTIKPQVSDKPIVKKDEMKKVINNEGYTVTCDTKGRVVGFNKETRKYFTIYAPKNGESASTDIGFADSENNILNISTAEGKFQYNLKTDQLKSR